MSDPAAVQTVTLTIDDKEVTVPKGTLIIRAAEQLGIEIPRFCDHPLLEPVGACRQCYVEIEGSPKLATSCTTTVAPGMIVRSQNTSEGARGAQEANLEFLLLNHPLDCPVCDRGGECPLQDQALAFGTGRSRYIEAKRTYPKPLPLSPLVNLDRERCVLCARCTRFCDEISGDRFLELYSRGAGERVGIAAGEDFRSPFSGNTVQICPVGALTSTPYRFAARPFDLSSGDSICPHCASGCAMKVDVRRGEVVRQLARDDLEVNDAWLCDKGRYAFRFPDAHDRVATPLVREHGLEPVSFGEALSIAAERMRGARVGILTGGHLTDEDSYALSKLARTVLHTDDLDHRRSFANTGEVERFVATPGPWHVTYKDVEQARVILVAGLDAEQELPILHLRLRKAARRGARIFVLHPRRTRLHDVAEHVLCAPGAEGALLERIATAEAGDPELGDLGPALRDAGEDAIVIAGPRLADSAPGAAPAAALAERLGAGLAVVSRRANDHGALLAGIAPGLYPGGRTRQEIEAVWGMLSIHGAGRDQAAILEAAAAREIDVLYLAGVDPLRDFPDAELARRALENVRFKVVQDLRLGAYEPFVDVFLPAAAFLEKEGHFTTWEGRGRRLHQVRKTPGIARPDWEIFAGLAEALGGDLGFETLEDVQAELGSLLVPRDVTPFDFSEGGSRRTASALVPGPSTRTWPDPASEADAARDVFTLVTYPLLVDEGLQSDGASELKAALQEPAFCELHTDDAVRLGITDGTGVIVRTEVGEATLPARVTDHIAASTLFIPFNNPGLATNKLLSGRLQATATVEPIESTAAASSEVAPETVPTAGGAGK